MAEHFKELYEDRGRLGVRGDIKQWNQMLAETENEQIARLKAKAKDGKLMLDE